MISGRPGQCLRGGLMAIEIQFTQRPGLVATQHNLHGSIGQGGLADGQKYADHLGGGKIPVGSILMPGHPGALASALDRKIAGPQQQVGADCGFHRIQNHRIMDNPVQPGGNQVRFSGGTPVSPGPGSPPVGNAGTFVRGLKPIPWEWQALARRSRPGQRRCDQVL